MALLSTALCTVAEVERFFSSTGVAYAADNDGDGSADTDVVEDSINQATEELELFLTMRYAQADLANSTLVNRWCVVLATRFLCQRRGNVVPASIETEWMRLMDLDSGLVIQIADGLRQLPGVNLRADLRPTWSNLEIDRRWNRSSVRVTTSNSADAPTEMSQDTAWDWPRVLN